MKTITWKRNLGTVWGIFTPRRPRKVILLYHTLGTNPPAVTEERFRQQIAWLTQNGSIVSLGDLLNADSPNTLQVAISFDDGYASLLDNVAPILAEYGATATVFLNTGRIGDSARIVSDAALGHYPDEQFLSWKDVEALVKSSWTIGSHGVEHLDLTRQSSNSVERELVNSKRKIELRLGKPCQHFAYTWGNFTPALQDALKKAGYVTGASGLHGAITATSDQYALPRIDVRAEYELRDFVDVVRGCWDYLGFKQGLMRRLT